MRLLPFLIGLIFSVSLNAQTTKGFEWIRHHGDNISSDVEWVQDIQTDNAGNVYVGGEVNPIFVRDSLGNPIPSIRFAPFDSIINYGRQDIWLAKYDPQGNLLWHRYSGGGNDDRYDAMVTDQNGNIYVAGRVSSTNTRPARTFGGDLVDPLNHGTFIAKVSPNGSLLWHKSFGGDTIQGSFLTEFFTTVLELQIENNTLNAFISGGSDQPFGFIPLFGRDSLDDSIHEVSFDLNGNYLGVESFDFPRADRLPQIFSIEKNQNGAFISGILNRDTTLVGNDTILKVGLDNAVVLAFDTNLNFRSAFYSMNGFDQFFDADIVGDTIIAVGNFDVSINRTVTFDTISYTAAANEFQIGGAFLFDANTTRLIGLYPSRSLGSNPRVRVNSAYAEKSGFGIGGSFNHQMTFSGGSNYLIAESRNAGFTNNDLYFAFFDRNGNLIAEDVIYTSSFQTDAVIAMHRRDSIMYIGGFVGDSVQIAGVDSFVTRGTSDAFLAAYNIGQITTSIEENAFIKADNGILAYPNPTLGQVNLMGKAIHNEAQLFNLSGQLVRSYPLNTNAFNQPINLEGLETGVYFLMITNGEERQQLKIVKQ